MNNNKIEELQERLEELHRTQDARLACGADDLDIIEEISEVEAEIKELQDDINEKNNNGNDTNVGSIGNSIEDIARIAKLITTKFNNDYSIDNKDKEAIEHVLSDYKRVLKENEELKKSKITYEKVRDIQEKNRNIVDNKYIPKQKIKDKIEEINKKILNAPKYDEKISVYRYQKQILQELIEESEEN